MFTPGLHAGAYDDENELSAVQWGGSNDRTEFAYDGLGRLRQRTEKNYSGGIWTVTGVTRYVYDGRRVIQERDTNNAPTVSYTRGNDLSGSFEGAGGIGGLLARSSGYSGGSWTSHACYYADGNGNIANLTDANQNVVATYRYDPFGNTTYSSGTLASANAYRYSSKEIMLKSAQGGWLYSYGFRFYDPNLQRWLNRDPIGERGGINLYRFVYNNTLSWFDRDGLIPDGFTPPPIRPTLPPPTDPTQVARGFIGTPFWNFWWPDSWFLKTKCNKFVGDCISAVPDRPKPVVPGGLLRGLCPGWRYPTAPEWKDSDVNIPGYGPPHLNPQPGDVVTDGNHLGFMVGGGYIEAPTWGLVKFLPTNNPIWNPDWGRAPIPPQPRPGPQ
jgi:RHS repeat-associated protein